MYKSINRGLAVWALCITSFLLMGMTVPHQFSPGDVVSASEMNAGTGNCSLTYPTPDTSTPANGCTVNSHIRDMMKTLSGECLNTSLDSIAHWRI